jgi:hypothetical protein
MTGFSEDMVRVLGKRPFEGKSDDMDKYLDEEVCSSPSVYGLCNLSPFITFHTCRLSDAQERLALHHH